MSPLDDRKRSVEEKAQVRSLDRPKARFFEECAKSPQLVPAKMMQVLVVDVVQVRPGWYFHNGDAARLQNPRDLVYRRAVFLDVLEDIQHHDSIHAGGRQRTLD